ncbi:hypothetical protein KDI_32220 [Dictyobacter arantiisoli]|uniref:VWFA domain-containing protein n=1 Tax=Dictyobacter arantiisoli TaxID=2014874 RepID=A0A5A5TEJ0_9CHLR|nr:hypothetical protein KDI_32220 [Dictyobacter arantiisoli]
MSRLNWRILRPLASYLGGSEHSYFLGPGVEFSEIRAYQPGDDIRFIDWNISARMEQPMIRESRVERALDVWFLLDTSASTNWGTANCLKREQALEFVALAGQLLSRAGNRLGALLFAEYPGLLIPPACGHVHLTRLLTQLHQQVADPHGGPTDLTAVLKRAHTVIRRRSLIVLISDFLVTDGWQSTLAKLAQRHEIIAVRITDPREGELPDVGLVTFEDPETGQQLLVDTSNARLRARFQQSAHQQTQRLQADLIRCGSELLSLSTDAELLATLISFLQKRQTRRLRHTSTLPRVGHVSDVEIAGRKGEAQ